MIYLNVIPTRLQVGPVPVANYQVGPDLVIDLPPGEQVLQPSRRKLEPVVAEGVLKVTSRYGHYQVFQSLVLSI